MAATHRGGRARTSRACGTLLALACLGCGSNALAQAKSKAEVRSASTRSSAPSASSTRPTLTPQALDVLIRKEIDAARAPVSSLTTDAEFVRRVYFDVTGAPPTPEQVIAFHKGSGTTSRRGRLVDQLLNSDEYARNWARYWRDVIQFQATNANGNEVRYEPLEDWLAGELAKNTRWDVIARALLTTNGRNDEEGAVNFALSHSADPVELAGEVSRIFLGVQIQCAQCHDHPTDRWKREQFHEFAAYFEGAKKKRLEKGGKDGKDAFELLSQKGKPRYTMTDLKDPTKKVAVEPAFFLGSEGSKAPKNLSADERRALAASLITSTDNPWFAKAFVNRVWGALMGEGFYQPLDDIGPDRECRSPEALEALATAFQRGGHDVKWLLRTILNTEAYQRQVRSTFSEPGRTPFASNCTARLRADQIADALARTIDMPVDEARGARDRKEILGLFGVDPSMPIDQVLGTIPQALYLMNGGKINRAIGARKDSMLGQVLDQNPKDNLAALQAIYLRVLSRMPTAKEVEVCGRYVAAVKNRREAFEDILWSLVNSTEFISRR